MSKKVFNIGDWWETRDGSKVLIWFFDPFNEGMPIIGAFYRGGMKNFTSTGRATVNWRNLKKHPTDRSDLMKRCSPPKEFNRE